MEIEQVEEMEVEVLSSMWPEDINEAGNQFNIEKPGIDLDLEEVMINEEPTVVDFMRLSELTNYSERGSSQVAYLVKNWEYKQENAVRLLREELDNLSKQQEESKLKKLKILEEHRFEEERYGGDKRPISILDEKLDYVYQDFPKRRHDDVVVEDKRLEIDAQYDSVIYWKQRAMHLEKLLEASIQRELTLLEKLNESIECLRRQASPVEELSQVLKRADNFLHFILQNAPVVIGHQDKELRYRFIYNHFPSLREEDIIGKTDVEIFHGAGVKESQDFKKEVLERGLPAKREITFETELFGSKTFLIYVEPVFSKSGETIGVNYMGMEITDQVRKREKMAILREEIAVQKAKETELNKTIHITEETMRAKQMLATMSHEIRSPLSGVVSMTEILANTNLDKEQKQLVKVMLSSGDLVLQLINDILDLSKVESGVMKLEAAKFRPREVVKHVLQTAAASLQKLLTLEGHIAEDVPIELIGDVLRIRQILTNLISNAIKFTHEGKVGIKLYVVKEPQSEEMQISSGQENSLGQPRISENAYDAEKCSTMNQNFCKQRDRCAQNHGEESHENHTNNDNPQKPKGNATTNMEDDMSNSTEQETTVWLCCDVFDTGIGIPDKALPSLFKKYMQVGADTARKYGGTGLGLAICKQLVELMGGHISVTSKEHFGSTFTFILPYKVLLVDDASDDPDDLLDGHDVPAETEDDINSGFFQFLPRTLGSLFSSHGSSRVQTSSLSNVNKSISMPESYISHSPHRDMLEETNASDNSTLVGITEASFELRTIPNHKHDDDNEHMRQGHRQFSLPGTLSDASGTNESPTENSGSKQASPLQGPSDRSSECSTCCSPEISKSILKPRILLVEDNKINVMVTQSFMKRLGHNIDVVNNGVEAVRAVQRSSYDLILMDVYMPVMDGLQATRIIRSFEESGNWDAAAKAEIESDLPLSDYSSNGQGTALPIRRMPIIAMTANSFSESAEQCFANGMDSYVSKPVTFDKLKQCLQQYLHVD